MELLIGEPNFGPNDEVVSITPMVVKRTAKQARERKLEAYLRESNVAAHTPPPKRVNILDKCREIVYEGSRLGLEAAIAGLNFRELEAKHGRFELKTTFNPVDRMYYICVM